MIMNLALAITLTIFNITLSEAAPTLQARNLVSDHWLLSYKDKSTNQVRWDPRLLPLLREGLPHYVPLFADGTPLYGDNGSKKQLPDVALLYLSGHPEPVRVESSRYVTLAAVVWQAGSSKGLLWVDTEAPPQKMIFVAMNENFGKTNTASLILFTSSQQWVEKLPPQFLTSLVSWLSAKGVQKVTSFEIQNAEKKDYPLPVSLLGSF